MKILYSRNWVLLAVLSTITAAASINGQTSPEQPLGHNNPYSPSPNGKAPAKLTPPAPTRPPREISISVISAKKEQTEDRPAFLSQERSELVKPDNERSLAPSEVYKIGIGDVLSIHLVNAPQAAGYYTVRSDGTIDFPLAGETVGAAGSSIESLRKKLTAGITLYPDPQIEVKIREYASHKIAVSGMVGSGGERSLQREAVPLFVIKAETLVDRDATKALIRHGAQTTAQTIDLLDPSSDAILIYPGDSIEFTNETRSEQRSANVYYMAGDNVSAGQRQLSQGLTLYQAIVASGASRTSPKKATIRRKNEKGVLAISEYNVRSIRDGKAADPVLAAGDVVEIRN